MIARHFGNDGDMLTERTALVDPDGKIYANTEDEVPPGSVDSSGSTNLQIVDFDHDGTDETVWVFSSDKRGILEEILIVTRFKYGKWEQFFDRQFQYDNGASEPEGGEVNCEATWAIDPAGADGKRTITFTPKGKAKGKGDECIVKKETWAVAADGKFAVR